MFIPPGVILQICKQPQLYSHRLMLQCLSVCLISARWANMVPSCSLFLCARQTHHQEPEEELTTEKCNVINVNKSMHGEVFFFSMSAFKGKGTFWIRFWIKLDWVSDFLQASRNFVLSNAPASPLWGSDWSNQALTARVRRLVSKLFLFMTITI